MDPFILKNDGGSLETSDKTTTSAAQDPFQVSEIDPFAASAVDRVSSFEPMAVDPFAPSSRSNDLNVAAPVDPFSMPPGSVAEQSGNPFDKESFSNNAPLGTSLDATNVFDAFDKTDVTDAKKVDQFFYGNVEEEASNEQIQQPPPPQLDVPSTESDVQPPIQHEAAEKSPVLEEPPAKLKISSEIGSTPKIDNTSNQQVQQPDLPASQLPPPPVISVSDNNRNESNCSPASLTDGSPKKRASKHKRMSTKIQDLAKVFGEKVELSDEEAEAES